MNGSQKLTWKLPGNVVPPVTPFTAAGEVDYAVLEREIDYVVTSSRPAAICVAGVEAREYQYLSDDERRLLIRETIAMIGVRVPALVGISHASYRTSIARRDRGLLRANLDGHAVTGGGLS